MDKLQYFTCLILCCAVVSCNRANHKKQRSALNSESALEIKKDVYSDSIMRYVEFDSAYFHITEKYFLKAKMPFAIHRVDTLRKIDSITYFKKNTPLYTAIRTHPNGIEIGVWKQNDQQKSIIANFDDSLQVNYWEAVKIAKQKGFNFPNMEVTIIQSTSNPSWGFYRINNDKQMPQSLLIDTKTGRISELKVNINTNE